VCGGGGGGVCGEGGGGPRQSTPANGCNHRVGVKIHSFRVRVRGLGLTLVVSVERRVGHGAVRHQIVQRIVLRDERVEARGPRDVKVRHGVGKDVGHVLHVRGVEVGAALLPVLEGIVRAVVPRVESI
jgi:hypothetical protein